MVVGARGIGDALSLFLDRSRAAHEKLFAGLWTDVASLRKGVVGVTRWNVCVFVKWAVPLVDPVRLSVYTTC